MSGGVYDFAQVLGLLRRRSLLIAIAVLAAMGCAVLALAVTPPLYTARALVYVDPDPRQLLSAFERADASAGDAARVESEVAILASDRVLLAVVERLELAHAADFAPQAGWIETIAAGVGLAAAEPPSGEMAMRLALERLRKSASASRLGPTYLMSVEARSERPERAAQIANILAATYVELNLVGKVEALEAARAVVERTLALNQQAGFRETLSGRAQALALETQLQIAGVSIVSPAIAPTAPSAPNPRLVLTLAGLFGLGFGIVLAFVTENNFGGFTTPGQMAGVLRLPVLGVLPRQRLPEGPEVFSVADQIAHAPLSGFAEAVRQVRAAIDNGLALRPATGAGAVIALASAEDGEGKTVAALAIARTYALAGAKTVIVDCDLRAPSLNAHLGTRPSNALRTYLAGAPGDILWQDMIVSDHVSPLAAIIGGDASATPTDHLVTGAAFGRLIEALRARFDIVVLDTHALERAVDGLYLARQADIVVLVAAAGTTPQRDIRTVRDRLAGALKPGAALAGILSFAQARGSEAGNFRRA